MSVKTCVVCGCTDAYFREIRGRTFNPLRWDDQFSQPVCTDCSRVYYIVKWSTPYAQAMMGQPGMTLAELQRAKAFALSTNNPSRATLIGRELVRLRKLRSEQAHRYAREAS